MEKQTTKPRLEHRIRFSGVTKDGIYSAEKVLELDPERDNVFTVPKVITENGYQNVTVKLDGEGRLLVVQIERWDPSVQ
jgi:hypothetical protein